MPDGSKFPDAYSIRFTGSSMEVRCFEDQKILMAMEEQIHVPNPRPVRVGCRKGGCGACRVKVISGGYEVAKMSRAHVSESEELEGYALACRISPKSDLEIEAAYLRPRRSGTAPAVAPTEDE